MSHLVMTLAFLQAGLIKHSGVDYAPPGGNYTIKFPAPPKETTLTSKTSSGELNVVKASYESPEGNLFVVSYADLPAAAAKKENLKILFDGIREGAMQKDGTMHFDVEWKLGPDEFPGRKFDLKKGDQLVKLWVVLRDRRLYQIAVIGTDDFIHKKQDAVKFLESFQLSK